MPRARAGTDSGISSDGLTTGERRELKRRQHRHVAELHGPNETRNLKRWAARQVLQQAGYRPHALHGMGLL